MCAFCNIYEEEVEYHDRKIHFIHIFSTFAPVIFFLSVFDCCYCCIHFHSKLIVVSNTAVTLNTVICKRYFKTQRFWIQITAMHGINLGINTQWNHMYSLFFGVNAISSFFLSIFYFIFHLSAKFVQPSFVYTYEV